MPDPTIKEHIQSFINRSKELHDLTATALTMTDPNGIGQEMETRMAFKLDLLHLYNGVKKKIVELETLGRDIREAMANQTVDIDMLKSQKIEAYVSRKLNNV